MKYSIEQSEITERTEQINKFALLVDVFNNKAVERETFMAELSKIEQTDWAKENLFNQLIGYCVLGDAYGILNCKNGDIRQEILIHSQNMLLLGLYNIKLDVYGMKTDWYVVDE